MLLVSLPLQAQEAKKQVYLTGGAGLAFSDFEGLFIDLGVNYQLMTCVFIQALLDYYFNPSGEKASGVSDSAWGINLYGVYKKPLKNKFSLFGKAGIHLTSTRVSSEFMGFKASASSSDFGIAVGTGLEYRLKQALALVMGLTFKTVFADETGSWFKIYAGVIYHLTK